MRIFYYAVSILLAGVLQTTLFSKIEFLGAKPLLLLCFTVCVALLRGSLDGGAVGLFSGLMMDFLGGKIMGINGLLFMYTGVVVGHLCSGFFKEKAVVAVFFTGLSSFAYALTYYFFTFFIWGETRIFAATWQIILPEVAYTAIMALPIFIMATAVNKRLTRSYP